MYTVDPTFSVYRLFERIESHSILLNHRRIVAIMHDWLASLVDAHPLSEAEKAHDFVQQRALIGRSYNRLNQKVGTRLQTATTRREITTAIESSTPR